MLVHWFLCLPPLFNAIHGQPLYRTTTNSPNLLAAISTPKTTTPPSLSNAVIRKRLTCTETAFNFTIEFERPFYGIIYTEGMDNPRCVYVEGWTNPKNQYQFFIPIDSCGSITTRNGTLFQTANTFLVQRDPKLIELNDNAYTVVCQRFYPTNRDPSDQSAPGSATIIYERFEVMGPTEEVITRSVNEVIGKEVQFGTRLALGEDPDGPLPERPVQLGEKLTYVFYCNTNTSTNLDRNSASKDCTVGECVATDPTGTKRVQLSDHNGCSKHPSVWSNFYTHDIQLVTGLQARKIFMARLSAWSFPTSSHVLISCKAKICDGSCANELSKCTSASIRGPGFELASSGSREFVLNDTSALGGADRLANDAVDRSSTNSDDAIVAYKVDRPNLASGYFPDKLCPLPQQRRDHADPVSQPEMITAEMPNLLLSHEPVLPAPTVDFDSSQSPAQSIKTTNNNNVVISNANSRKCVAMDVFVGLISTLLTALGLMTFILGFLMWKLHKYNSRTNSLVRIEKRGCTF